jgi:hypothetical protein
MLNPLELGHQAKDITENPYLGDLVAAVSEHRGTGILNSSSSCRDVEKLTSMRTARYVRRANALSPSEITSSISLEKSGST